MQMHISKCMHSGNQILAPPFPIFVTSGKFLSVPLFYLQNRDNNSNKIVAIFERVILMIKEITSM